MESDRSDEEVVPPHLDVRMLKQDLERAADDDPVFTMEIPSFKSCHKPMTAPRDDAGEASLRVEMGIADLYPELIRRKDDIDTLASKLANATNEYVETPHKSNPSPLK